MNICIECNSQEVYDTNLWDGGSKGLERLKTPPQKSDGQWTVQDRPWAFLLIGTCRPLTGEVKIGLESIIWRIISFVLLFVCFMKLTQILGFVLFAVANLPMYFVFTSHFGTVLDSQRSAKLVEFCISFFFFKVVSNIIYSLMLLTCTKHKILPFG